MKKVAGTLKLLYSQYRELRSFAQFGSDLDADTKERLALGERIVEILKQNKTSPVEVGCQVAIIYAAVHGFLKNVEVTDVSEYEHELYAYMRSQHSELLTEIAKGQYTDEMQSELDTAVSEFTEKYIKTK